MSIKHVAVAGTAEPLIATPSLPTRDFVGPLTLQYKPTRSDNTTPATGKIYIGWDGGVGAAVTPTNYDAYLDPTMTSATRDLGTNGLGNAFQKLSGTYINSDVNGEGVSFFHAEG